MVSAPSALGPSLPIEGLAVAGGVLEGCEARRRLARAGTLAAQRREHGAGADQPAEEKRAQPLCPRFPVHATIVGAASSYESHRIDRSFQKDTRAKPASPEGGTASGALICALGDLLLDVIVRAPQPLAEGADTPVETRVASGGQAANVASWVVTLGEEARLVAKQADDEAGALVRALLERHGVELVGPRIGGKTGVVVSLVALDGERSMATDRGVAPQLRTEELDAAWFAGCRWLHLSGYSLLAEPIGEAALAAARLAREEGSRVSVDLSSWSAIRDYGPPLFRTRLEELAPDVVFANEPEWELVGGAYGLGKTAVVKRGSRGVSVLSGDGAEEHPPVEGEVVDTTGAGDALAAGFIVGGIELGLEAAARCVGQLGAVPV
jgi:ribokinase